MDSKPTWNSPLEGLPLGVATDPDWVQVAVQNLDRVLVDHAHCEHKAATTALGMTARYPDYPQLVRPMVALAQEELRHFRQVYDLLEARGLPLGAPRPDRYVKVLRQRLASEGAGIGGVGDHLLLSAFIEARSCERFRHLAAGLRNRDGDGAPLGRFYERLAAAEGRHWELFRDLAFTIIPRRRVERRLEEAAEIEAAVIGALPLEPRIH